MNAAGEDTLSASICSNRPAWQDPLEDAVVYERALPWGQ
jgi:hypothetical protein